MNDAASSGRHSLRGFVAFKWLVYVLLAGNVMLYGMHGTVTEQIDTGAWVVLLLLFEWETGDWRTSPRLRRWLHGLRIPAAAAVVWACFDYALAREWLDFGNALTWLGVVALLELEVRIPAQRPLAHALRRWATGLLYLALAGFLLTWFVRGVGDGTAAVWLDAWDALLWLVAFVVIELNVFGFEQRPTAA